MRIQPLQSEHAYHICLGLFQAGETSADGFANFALALRRSRIVRTELVADFVHERGGQISVAGSFGGLIFAH